MKKILVITALLMLTGCDADQPVVGYSFTPENPKANCGVVSKWVNHDHFQPIGRFCKEGK